jgi:hypothetical protein
METVRLILKILKLCTGVSTLCDFIFAYSWLSSIWLFDGGFTRLYNFKTADCMATEEISFKATVPVIAFFSTGAGTHKDRLFLSQNRRGCSEKVKRSSNTENIFQ